MEVKLIIIGNYFSKTDEGFTKLSHQYYNYLSPKLNVKRLHTTKTLSFSSIVKIIRFKPDIIHYLTGPTIRSFIICFLLKTILLNRTIIVISATRPFIKESQFKYIRYLKPDLILTQADKWRKIFNKLSIPTVFIPNVIDIKRFKKMAIEKKILRKKYQLPQDKKLLLTVGHIRANRNLEILCDLQSELFSKGYQLVVVGSTFFEPDHFILNKLKDAGCIVIKRYIKKIEEIYNACDLYIFPIDALRSTYFPKEYLELGAIDMPLSILEALSCELPVLSPEIDSINVLLEGISKPPFFQFDGSKRSFIKELESIYDHYGKGFYEIRKRIDEETIFAFLEITYKKLLRV